MRFLEFFFKIYTIIIIVKIEINSQMISDEPDSLDPKKQAFFKNVMEYNKVVNTFYHTTKQIRSDFESEKQTELTKVHDIYDSLQKTVEVKENSLAGFTHLLCKDEEEQLKAYDYESIITDALVKEEASYEKAVENTENLVGYCRQELNGFRSNVTICNEFSCIDKLNELFKNFKKNMNEEMDEMNTNLCIQIDKYKSSITYITVNVTQNIRSIGDVAVDCLTNVLNHKAILDKLKFLKDDAVQNIMNKRIEFSQFTTQVIGKLNLFLGYEVFALEDQIKEYEDKAINIHVNIEKCSEKKTQLYDLINEITMFFRKTIDRSRSSMSNIAEATISCINSRTILVVDGFLTMLNQCFDQSCETEILQEINEINTTSTSEATSQQLISTLKRIDSLKSDIEIIETNYELNFIIKAQLESNTVINCIKLTVEENVENMIKGVIFDIANTVNDLDSTRTAVLQNWYKNKEETISSLEKSFHKALKKITHEEIKASKHVVNISECLVNKTAFFDILLPTTLQEISKNINTTELVLNTIVKEYVEEIGKSNVTPKKCLLLLYTCDKNDTICVGNVKSECDSDINSIVQKNQEIMTELNKKIAEYSQALQKKIDSMFKMTSNEIDIITHDTLECIQRISSCALFIPSAILVFLGLLLQTFLI